VSLGGHIVGLAPFQNRNHFPPFGLPWLFFIEWPVERKDGKIEQFQEALFEQI
jgi:hypothetical protein